MRNNITKNYLFRWFECGLSVDEAARLCFKSVSTIKSWDAGKPIPPECRLLMQLATGRRLSPMASGWEGWVFSGSHLVSPDGLRFTPRRITELQFLLSNSKESLSPGRVRNIRERLNRATLGASDASPG